MAEDTPQQKAILRQSRVARKIRAVFPEGTRVSTRTGAKGTVLRHVPLTNGQGGYLVILWDTGRQSNISPINLYVIKEENTNG